MHPVNGRRTSWSRTISMSIASTTVSSSCARATAPCSGYWNTSGGCIGTRTVTTRTAGTRSSSIPLWSRRCPRICARTRRSMSRMVCSTRNVFVQRSQAVLLHFTTTQGITERMKKSKLMELFNATGRPFGDATADQRRLDMATWKVLGRLQTSWPMVKRPCFEGIHIVVAGLLQSGLYEELLA
mmetsp:Transcript_95578/g.308331  ORF Transcript_95578/g.308331 Transcript_95578/m.308331 type:complete len:184 (-) Transcript_95578:67-618(-)